MPTENPLHVSWMLPFLVTEVSLLLLILRYFLAFHCSHMKNLTIAVSCLWIFMIRCNRIKIRLQFSYLFLKSVYDLDVLVATYLFFMRLCSLEASRDHKPCLQIDEGKLEFKRKF
jgi:hypothetical protein